MDYQYMLQFVNLENIMPSERRQTQKATCCAISFTHNVAERGNSPEREGRLALYWGWECRQRRLAAKEQWVPCRAGKIHKK